MNRYFISDKESDILITVATKVFGLKIGEHHQYGNQKRVSA